MKIILLFFFASSLWANEECATSQIEISSEISDLAQSKCDIPARLDPCSTCAPPLLKPNLKETQKPTEQDVRRESLKVAIDEYKKVVIRNIVDLTKARTLPNSSHNFKFSLLECKARTPTCSNNKKIKDEKILNELFGDLNDKIGSEIANIISKKPLKNEGLLTRTKDACFIPEQTILQVSANTIAEVLDTELISILEKIDITKYHTLNDLFDDYENEAIFNKLGDNAADIIRYSKSNPYLKDIFSSPKGLSEFIERLPSPKTSDSVRSQIYFLGAGENLDNEIAKRCKESFEQLTKFVCSEEFDNAEINIDPKKNFDHLIGNQQNTLHSETPIELFLEQKNKANMFCNHRKSEKEKKIGLDLEEVRTRISSSLHDLKKEENSLRQFNDAIYKEEFKGTTDLLCKEIQTDNCTDMTNMRCRLVANYKKTLVKDSPEYKMANSSNDDVNAVLRGMIADPAKLDPEVREVLVKEGILPDSKGNIAETGNIPERQPMVMGQASGTTQAKAVATSSAPSSKANTSNRERPSFERPQNFALPTRAQANTTAVNLPPLPDFSGMFEKSDDMKRFEEEIQRRLMGLDEPSKPRTIEQAKKVIRDTANSMPNRPNFRPNVENKMAERLLESQRVAPASKSPQSIEQEKMAQAAQDAKWEKELQNRAVSNMAGVRAALEKNGLADPSSKGASQAGAQKKDLTKVALNIPEDPKVNLTEVFGKKYNGNDPETEVLKVLLSSKNDFLLKINSLDFKITFDENKQFKVLLQEGDKEEAFRIRPQLELFLKRLSDKNSTNKISVDISRN